MQMIVERNDFWELKNNSWSGAIDTLNDIERANLEDEFMDFLENIFYGETPTETEVNDFIWFDRDYIYESLGLDENGEIPTEDEEEDEEE